LQTAIAAAEDEIFSQFCAEINVSNIRDYEESQLKLAQEQSEIRLQFDKQIQRLTLQFVAFIRICHG
jgi:structural maintenance of chromosome 1